MTGANAFAVDYLVESFDGTGENASNNGSFIGLDLPDWSIQGDPTFADGSLVFINETEEGDEFDERISHYGALVTSVASRQSWI
ncbi:MAG: hypothetical protein R3C28_03470 [Pirellulaceae bacterium]